jgi:DNA polymerase
MVDLGEIVSINGEDVRIGDIPYPDSVLFGVGHDPAYKLDRRGIIPGDYPYTPETCLLAGEPGRNRNKWINDGTILICTGCGLDGTLCQASPGPTSSASALPATPFTTENPMSQEDKEAQLAALYAEYATSPVLQQVADGRRLVRGYGPLEAPLVVIGEAPGEQEDIQGRPFVGPSGRLLQELFARAELPWDLCYVTNVLPWRPPGNRTPYQFEIIASYPRVEREIDLIQPVLVVAAGSVAWHAVSQAELGAFTTARSHWMQVPWKDWMVLPVFHPSAILRAHGAERAQMEEQTIRALRSALAGADA